MKESEQSTIQHIRRVQALLSDVAGRLIQRAIVHDASKLEEPEASIFDEFTAKLKDSTYGSEEYKQFLAEMKPALDHHYANNRHHPEYFRWHCPVCNLQISNAEWASSPQGPNDSGVRYCPNCCRNGMLYESELMLKPELGINGMTLLDLIEMLVDWKAAGERHENGSIAKSLEVNKKRFGYGSELQAILSRTVDELWG